MQTFRSVPELISDLSHNDPHSIALSFADQHLTAAELDRRADQFAAYLAQLGVVSGGTVAICMDRSLDWIVAALGILRAGSAYVPLDPAWPDSRLRFAVEDSGATVLVARAAVLDRLRFKTRRIDPTVDADAIAAAPGVARRPIEPEGLAYLIYTSGSTGVPKGVEITHANLSHLIRWHLEAFRVTRHDRASHLAGLGFDAAVWELWPNLCAGATVCLATDTVRSSPQALQEWMVHERVTIGFVPTVHAASMMAMEWPATTVLRLLLTGGDVLHHAPATKLPFDVINNYGPTECTVVATSATVKPGSVGAPPIGRPVAGAAAYLLNEDAEPVPVGSVGEIFIGGGGVGRGYRNMPELTAQSFRPDPFAGVPGARMYRTGDRGVQRPDGEFEFRGRLDRQTKIRGQRVELDEIGSILARHPSVDFATAIANVSKAGANQLVGYVLPKKNGSIPTSQELQQHLLRRLPDYMVPAVFVRLHALPISANGKIDLSMLPPPDDSQRLECMAARTPASPIEEKLLALVQQLLGNNEVSAQDSFFLAGGHSLLAMQLLMRLQDAFSVDLSLRQLFEAPTVERLAALIERTLEKTRPASIWEDLLGTKPVGLDDNFFALGGSPPLVAALQQRIATEFGKCVPMDELYQSQTVRQQAELTQSRLKANPALPPGVFAIRPSGIRQPLFWIHYSSVDLARELGDDQPFYSVMLAAEDFASLGDNATLQNIAACLLRKIVATQPAGPYAIGGFCLGAILSFEIAFQLRAAGHEVSLLVLLDSANPSCVPSCDSLSLKMKYAEYLLKRVKRLGVGKSLEYLRERLRNPSASVATINPAATKEEILAPDMMIAAMAKYQPQNYQGDVLLLLAAERPPHLNFLHGWQAVVTGTLSVQYLDAHHRDLAQGAAMSAVAKAIAPYLPILSQEKPVSRNAGNSPQLCPANRPAGL
jgi:amino acid adenylation domain-containing protein